MDRALALEFVRVTEAAAIAASHWLGKGDVHAADKAAVDAMRSRFNAVDFTGRVVIGEGDKDEAPMLFSGEQIGTGGGATVDIAVDPLECTKSLAKGRGGSISVLAAGPRGSLLHAPGTYMEQIAVGSRAKGVIDITASIKENVRNVASALNKSVDDVTVVLLEREKHAALIAELRSIGCRISLIEHGSVAAGMAAATEHNGVDMLVGICGAPEGVITAAGVKCLGGDFQGILRPHEEKYVQQAHAMGITDLDKVFTMEDLAKGNELQFVATGVSSGQFLRGVVFDEHIARTESVVMRMKSGTVRNIVTDHQHGRV